MILILIPIWYLINFSRHLRNCKFSPVKSDAAAGSATFERSILRSSPPLEEPDDRNESKGKASNASLSVSLCKCLAVCHEGDLHTLARFNLPQPSPYSFRPAGPDLAGGIMSRHNLKKLPVAVIQWFSP